MRKILRCIWLAAAFLLLRGLAAQEARIYHFPSREFTVSVGEAASNAHLRNFVSREFTVSVGEATSNAHLRNFVSREFTVSVGEATSNAHLRTFVSREFTVGIGEEVIEVAPATEILAGVVAISNGSQFVRNPQDATLAWRIVGPDGRVVASGRGVPLDDFAYQWNTSGLPDGTYTVFFTVSRPGQSDVTGSREYRLINQEYQGDEERELTISLLPGWNLVALPFRVDAVDAEELLALCPMNYASAVMAFIKSANSLPAGCALWLYSDSDETREITATTRYALDGPSVLPPFTKTGWQMTGLRGTEPLVVDCLSQGISAIWRWNGLFMEEVPIATTGLAYLEPFIGYFVQVK